MSGPSENCVKVANPSLGSVDLVKEVQSSEKSALIEPPTPKHISEIVTDLPMEIHYGIRCRGCKKWPIEGKRFQCSKCFGFGVNYSICEACQIKGIRPKTCKAEHAMERSYMYSPGT